MRLIRNHASYFEDLKLDDISNMLGHNFRLGEIECAIGIEQLKKLSSFVASRQRAATRLNEGLRNLKGLKLPIVKINVPLILYVFHANWTNALGSQEIKY